SRPCSRARRLRPSLEKPTSSRYACARCAGRGSQSPHRMPSQCVPSRPFLLRSVSITPPQTSPSLDIERVQLLIVSIHGLHIQAIRPKSEPNRHPQRRAPANEQFGGSLLIHLRAAHPLGSPPKHQQDPRDPGDIRPHL